MSRIRCACSNRLAPTQFRGSAQYDKIIRYLQYLMKLTLSASTNQSTNMHEILCLNPRLGFIDKTRFPWRGNRSAVFPRMHISPHFLSSLILARRSLQKLGVTSYKRTLPSPTYAHHPRPQRSESGRSSDDAMGQEPPFHLSPKQRPLFFQERALISTAGRRRETYYIADKC